MKFTKLTLVLNLIWKTGILVEMSRVFVYKNNFECFLVCTVQVPPLFKLNGAKMLGWVGLASYGELTHIVQLDLNVREFDANYFVLRNRIGVVILNYNPVDELRDFAMLLLLSPLYPR